MSKIKIKYSGDLRTESIHDDSGSIIVTDAPKDNQGLGRKFSPTDLVASALGSCLLTIMGIVSKRHSIDMKESCAYVEKIMTENPRMISALNVDIYLKGEISDKDKKILFNASKHCPVHNSLNKDIDIKINFRE